MDLRPASGTTSNIVIVQSNMLSYLGMVAKRLMADEHKPEAYFGARLTFAQDLC